MSPRFAFRLSYLMALALLSLTSFAADDPALLIADEEGRVGRRVVVVEQLEEEAEAAPLAGDGLAQHTLATVVIERPVLAVRADEERHRFQGSDEG